MIFEILGKYDFFFFFFSNETKIKNNTFKKYL